MKENRKIKSLTLIKETLEDEIVRLKERLKEYEIIEDDIADLSLYKEDVNRLQNENNLLVEELSKHIPRSVVDNIINPPKDQSPR